MTLEEMQQEMIRAMKDGKKLRKDTISSMISAIKKAAIDAKCKDNITEEFISQVILKEKKTMQEMIDTCPASREDTLIEYQLKMKVINEFAPKQLTEEELRQQVRHLLATIDIQGDSKGAVMKALMPRLKGKADGKLINKIICEEANV